MLFMRLHFSSFALFNEGLAVLYKWDDKNEALYHLAIIFLEAALFHFALKLRASIGRLPDKDLSEFLIEALLKGGFKTMASVLFVIFRSVKCAIGESVRVAKRRVESACFYHTNGQR